MVKTLYVSDLDATLLDRRSMVSGYTKSALNKLISRGIHFTIATGRTTDAARAIMADIELSVPIITFNGVIIYDVKNRCYVKVYRLSAKTTAQVVSILKAHGVSWLMYELKNNELVSYYDSLEHRPIYEFIEDRKARYNSAFSYVSDLRNVPAEHIIYFTLIDEYDRIRPVYDALKSIPNINITMVDDTSVNGLWWLEISGAEASKESSIIFFRETYGYATVIGFGDNYNDLPMFKVCDVSVAVKNALDEVKAAADHICEAHDNDGVVKWIANHMERRTV